MVFNKLRKLICKCYLSIHLFVSYSYGIVYSFAHFVASPAQIWDVVFLIARPFIIMSVE